MVQSQLHSLLVSSLATILDLVKFDCLQTVGSMVLTVSLYRVLHKESKLVNPKKCRQEEK